MKSELSSFINLHGRNYSKSTSVIKVNAMKIMDDFHYAKDAITCYYQLGTFFRQQRCMGHKGGHWLLHEECVVRTLVCQKAPLELK